MLNNLRISIAALATAGLIFSATIITPFGSLLGKHYKESKDYACCVHDQLIIHHYYTVSILGLVVSDGYTEEKTGKEMPGSCNIVCSDKY